MYVHERFIYIRFFSSILIFAYKNKMLLWGKAALVLYDLLSYIKHFDVGVSPPACGQVQKKWPQAVFLYTNQGKWLFIVLNVIKVCGIYCYIATE